MLLYFDIYINYLLEFIHRITAEQNNIEDRRGFHIDRNHWNEARNRFFADADLRSIPETKAHEMPEISKSLKDFIAARRQATESNEVLSEQQEDPQKHRLMCPLSRGFPLIPVRFNGRLYDYDYLMQLEKNHTIIDPFTRESIQLAPHVIQPDYEAQEKMCALISHIKNQSQSISALQRK